MPNDYDDVSIPLSLSRIIVTVTKAGALLLFSSYRRLRDGSQSGARNILDLDLDDSAFKLPSSIK